MGLGKFCNLNFLRIALAAVWKTEDHERNWMMGRELTEDTDLWGVCVCVHEYSTSPPLDEFWNSIF